MALQFKQIPQTSKDKALVVIEKITAGDYNAEKNDFPVSRLHAQFLIIGDTEILYKLERGGY